MDFNTTLMIKLLLITRYKFGYMVPSKCKKVAVDVIDFEFPTGLGPCNTSAQAKPPPVDINLKLRSDCKAHVM